MTYDPKYVERIARSLYDASKVESSSSWPAINKSCDRGDRTMIEYRNRWYSLAIAALDMAGGAQKRLSDEWQREYGK